MTKFPRLGTLAFTLLMTSSHARAFPYVLCSFQVTIWSLVATPVDSDAWSSEWQAIEAKRHLTKAGLPTGTETTANHTSDQPGVPQPDSQLFDNRKKAMPGETLTTVKRRRKTTPMVIHRRAARFVEAEWQKCQWIKCRKQKGWIHNGQPSQLEISLNNWR